MERAIDFGDCLTIGIVWTVDFRDFLLIGVQLIWDTVY